jgi:enterochelin esterase-like enzyme
MRCRILRLILIGNLIWGAIPSATAAQDRETMASPRLRALAAAVEAGEARALEDFWREVGRVGAPLVEEHASPERSIVTFVYRGGTATRSVRLSSGLNSLLVQGIEPDFEALGQMERLAGTDVWHLSFVVRLDLRVSYRFEVLDGAGDSTSVETLDPLNPRVYRRDREALRASLLELPGAPLQPWHERDEELGTWRRFKVVDGQGQENDVFAYLPGGFDRRRPQAYPVLIGLDSYSFGIGMPGALILDHLIETRVIPPTVMLAANVPAGQGLDQMERTAEYVAGHLLPELREELNLSVDPARVVIAGTSRRGLIAAYTAFARSESVGNVLSLSGSFYWKPDGEVEYEWFIVSRPKTCDLYGCSWPWATWRPWLPRPIVATTWSPATGISGMYCGPADMISRTGNSAASTATSTGKTVSRAG